MIFCRKYSPYQVKGSEQWSVEIVLLEMLNAPGSFLFVTFATTVSHFYFSKMLSEVYILIQIFLLLFSNFKLEKINKNMATHNLKTK